MLGPWLTERYGPDSLPADIDKAEALYHARELEQTASERTPAQVLNYRRLRALGLPELADAAQARL